MALIIGVVIVLLILFGFLCYKKAPPTEAIVVTGFGLARPKVVCGKGTFVLPVLQRADRLNMRLLKIDVKTPETGVKTQNGVSLWIDSVVTIQVYSENSTVLDEEVKASGLKDAKAYIMSRQQAAISNFLGMNEQGINDKVNDVLQGNLREIVSDMTVDQILTNRKQMALSVIENARPDLAKMGLEVVTFNVQDIRDAIAEKAQDEEVHEPAEKPKAAEEMPAPQEVKEPAMDTTTEHEPISPIVTAMVNDSVSNETLDDIANVMNGVVKEPEAEQNEEPEQGYISEQCDKPVEEEQQPEAAPTEEVQEEPAASEERNGPVSEELPAAEPESEEEHTEAVVDKEPVELTKFEQAMISLMKRGNIPENVYAIEEYKEGAVCLIRDDAHYFVYDCKDNQAQDVEMFEADKEKEIATTFATRIHEKLSKGA